MVYYENCNALSSCLEIDFSARTAKRYYSTSLRWSSECRHGVVTAS